MVKEESCHNFLSTRSCFCSSVSDGSYLMIRMTLRLLCMPAKIIQMMAFAQIIDIWRPGRSMEDHLKETNYWKPWPVNILLVTEHKVKCKNIDHVSLEGFRVLQVLYIDFFLKLDQFTWGHFTFQKVMLFSYFVNVRIPSNLHALLTTTYYKGKKQIQSYH